jgi:hypothetical protein
MTGFKECNAKNVMLKSLLGVMNIYYREQVTFTSPLRTIVLLEVIGFENTEG